MRIHPLLKAFGTHIIFSYLESEHDIEVLVRGFKAALRVAHSEPFSSYVDKSDPDPFFDYNGHIGKSDKELRETVRSRMETVFHPTSTARMAPLAEGGVVDYDLKVYGIEGLRVADASIFPTVPSGHTVCAISLHFFRILTCK